MSSETAIPSDAGAAPDSSPKQKPASQAPDAEPPAPSKRAKLFATALGVLLLCGGAWLLRIFSENPSGQFPWLPGTWKGAPLILGACFGGVYGALLLILRRFSLRAMLLCSILSAALAGGLTAYVQTITETQVLERNVDVEQALQGELQRMNQQTIDRAGIEAFLGKLKEAGVFARGADYVSVDVRLAPVKENSDRAKVVLAFSYQPYLGTPGSSSQEAALAYATALSELNKIKLYARAGRELPDARRPSGTVSMYWPEEIVLRPIADITWYNGMPAKKVDYEIDRTKLNWRTAHDLHRLECVYWLLEQMPDAELRNHLKERADAWFQELRQRDPALLRQTP